MVVRLQRTNRRCLPNLEPVSGGTGGIFNVSLNIGVATLPLPVLNRFIDDGARNVVADNWPTVTIARAAGQPERTVRQVWDNLDETLFRAEGDEPEEAAFYPALLELDEILPDLAAELLRSWG